MGGGSGDLGVGLVVVGGGERGPATSGGGGGVTKAARIANETLQGKSRR